MQVTCPWGGPPSLAWELVTIGTGVLRYTGTAGFWMDCRKCRCGLKTSNLFLVGAVTLQIHQRVQDWFHTTVHPVICLGAGGGATWRWQANKQQTCFSADNQPTLRPVISQYDWEMGRHNNIYIDVFSRNCHMLFLCHCKDAICWWYNKFPSLPSLRLSNPNLIISRQCCGLLLL